jgi:hypothetical protein
MDKASRELSAFEILGMMWRVNLDDPNPSYDDLIHRVESELKRKITPQEKSELFNLYSNPDFYTQVFDKTESAF